MDRLQTKIRKMKNPIVLDMTVPKEQLPPHLLAQEGNYLRAYGRFCMELMEGLRREITAVRYSYSLFSLLGTEGLSWLSKLCSKADSLGYYVLLDAPDVKTMAQTQLFAELIADDLFAICFDGLIVTAYIGSDGYSSYLPMLTEKNKELFVLLRTPNKTAAQVQDLMTGGRLVHTALADELVRSGKGLIGKCGYSKLGGVAAAASAGSLQQLRSKYKNLFLLVDGYEIPLGNTKNCALAFDELGHGAAICVSSYVTNAWQADGYDSTAFITCAEEAVVKLKNNIHRYITIL